MIGMVRLCVCVLTCVCVWCICAYDAYVCVYVCMGYMCIWYSHTNELSICVCIERRVFETFFFPHSNAYVSMVCMVRRHQNFLFATRMYVICIYTYVYINICVYLMAKIGTAVHVWYIGNYDIIIYIIRIS